MAGRKSQFVLDIPLGTYRGINVFKIQTKIRIKAKFKNNNNRNDVFNVTITAVSIMFRNPNEEGS